MKIHILQQDMAQYHLMPRVVQCGKAFTYTAKGLGIEAAFAPNAEYHICVIPQEENGSARMQAVSGTPFYEDHALQTDDHGVLHFELTLPKEQIYTLRLLNAEGQKLTDFRVFSAKQDLWERSPMRGNTHCHTCYSVDGHEDPIVAASVYRKAGFDYVAFTDHHFAEGSIYAVEHIKGIPTEMSLYYGEEVHVPNAYIHAVNVGALMDGGIGLDKWYHEHEDEAQREVDEIAAQAKGNLPEDIELYDYAWRKWVADTIRKNGGVAIAAHPFWEYDANNTPNAMLKYMAQTGMYDGTEIIFGQENPVSVEASRAVAFWNEMRAEGLFIPIIGADDAHRRSYAWDYACDFNNAYTILFSKNPEFDGFAEAVRSGYTAAVECYGDAPNHVVGTYRLTLFTQFLLQEYYPLHDELCFEEGCRIKEAYLGDEESLEVLKVIHGRVKRFTDKFFGRTH